MGHPEGLDNTGEFVALLTEIQLPLVLYVRSLLPGDPAAHDVAQQANTKIWEIREEFTLGTNFKSWAFHVARFEVLNYRKRQLRDARITFHPDLELTFASEIRATSDDLQRRHEALRNCLGKLRPKDRDLLLQRYRRDGTLADYAGRVGRSLGGLKVSLHRLRNALQACIQRELRGQGASP